jgi:hypothetical protein
MILSDAFGEGNLDGGQRFVNGFLGWIIQKKTHFWNATNQIGVILFECQLLESFGELRNYNHFRDFQKE